MCGLKLACLDTNIVCLTGYKHRLTGYKHRQPDNTSIVSLAGYKHRQPGWVRNGRCDWLQTPSSVVTCLLHTVAVKFSRRNTDVLTSPEEQNQFNKNLQPLTHLPPLLPLGVCVWGGGGSEGVACVHACVYAHARVSVHKYGPHSTKSLTHKFRGGKNQQ